MNTKVIFIFVVIIVVGVAAWLMLKNKGGEEAVSPTPVSASSPQATPTVTAESSPSSTNATDMEVPEKVAVKMETARGVIELELYSKVAPKTVLNFLSLAQKGFYEGTKFHRVVADFVIQGGDPLSKTDDPKVGTGGPGYTFEDEINPKSLGVAEAAIKQLEDAGYVYNYALQSLPNAVGAISMANAGPNTNGSQFFIITTKDQPFLNGKHTVFGKVVKGMDVVRAIKQGDVIKKISFDL